MDDDLIAGLTRQVKEEVIENYLRERRIVELQIEDLGKRARDNLFRAAKTGRRLNRLAQLMITPEARQKLAVVLLVPSPSFWADYMENRFSKGPPMIKVRGLTEKARFKKLVLEAYNRFHLWMERYRTGYEELAAECRAVNHNILVFQRNFDLLSILAFLRSLDIRATEMKRVLGQNFTPAEQASLDKRLYIMPVSCGSLEAPPPFIPPKPESIDMPLSELADAVYRRHPAEAGRFLPQAKSIFTA